MLLTRSLMAILLVTALGLTACANAPGMSTEIYPTPRPHEDLPVGSDEGLFIRDWDGGHPLRFVAFLANPVGVLFDLLFAQPLYLVAAQDPELWGYTNQDQLFRRNYAKYQYSWDTFYYQYQQYQESNTARASRPAQ